MLKDELDLDGRPNLNLASFVGTYMEKEAESLMVENLAKKYAFLVGSGHRYDSHSGRSQLLLSGDVEVHQVPY